MLPRARDTAECQWAALALVFLVLSVAMSVTPGLQLEARSTNTISQQECVPVCYDKIQHSSWDPYLIDQIPEYTIWQQFCIKNSTPNFTANFNPPKWSRQPYKLSYSKGRYHYNKTLHPYVTEDGRLCVNASITMYDLMGEIDYGDYKINVSTNCSSSEIVFQLTIDKCGIGDIPRPIQPTLKPLIVPEVDRQSALSWKYMFFGDNQLTDYIFRITKSGEIVCDESSPGSHLNCTRETLGQCNITITAHIQNYTHKDSGEYCAAAYPTGAPNPGNNSCLKFVVVQQPVFVKVPVKSHQLDLFKGASLFYHISNYSKYVDIVFRKDRIQIDPYRKGYKLSKTFLDNATIVMTLHMDGTPHHAGGYTLCTSIVIGAYTSTPDCTTSVSVIKDPRWNGEVAAIVLSVLIFGLATCTVLALVVQCCFRYRCCCEYCYQHQCCCECCYRHRFCCKIVNTASATSLREDDPLLLNEDNSTLQNDPTVPLLHDGDDDTQNDPTVPLLHDGDDDTQNADAAVEDDSEDIETDGATHFRPPPIRAQESTQSDPFNEYQDGVNSAPELPDLMNEVAAKIPQKWHEVGIQLGVEFDKLKSLSDSSTSDSRLFASVFTTWKNCMRKPYTWAVLIQALKSPAVKETRLAQELSTKLTAR